MTAEKTGAGGSAPAPVNVNGGRTIAQVIAEYDAALLAGDAQGTYLGRVRLRAFAAPAPVPAGDALRVAMLDLADKIEGNHILSGSPGPLYSMGWSAANESAARRIRAALSKQVPAGDAVARWPATRYVGRMGDMTPPGESVLRVMFDGDNDVIVEVWDKGRAAAVEFCNGGGGGGGSMNTRAALIALMVAIEKDNAERPHKEDELAKRLNSHPSREGQADQGSSNG